MNDKGQGPILIAGQTASGKSNLALKLAERLNGVIVNADSMQVYSDLQVLTARPSQGEMRDIQHYLYGHIDATSNYSVGNWLTEIEALLAHISSEGHTPIIVGGTGLYFKALLGGLSPVPEIPDEIRNKWRLIASDPDTDLQALLRRVDPDMAERLEPTDRQRLTRALEVKETTGRSLLYWRQQPERPVLSSKPAAKYVINIERTELYRRCDQRFDMMLQTGALDEVAALVERKLDPNLPLMKALGVRPLASYLRGECSISEAAEKAKTETRQYAKRQMTWFRGNMIAWNWINTQQMT